MHTKQYFSRHFSTQSNMPVARYLHKEGIFVSGVHAMLIHDYSGNTIKKGKTDKKDAIRIASFGLDRWLDLTEYIPEDDIRQTLKTYNRQYNQYMKLKTALKNNLISILDQTFPGINGYFTSRVRQSGHEKWVDFAEKFWHCECVSSKSEARFSYQYNRWCQKSGYHSNSKKVTEIHEMAKSLVATLPKDDFTKCLISQAITQLNAISQTLAVVRIKMQRLASMLPEYPVVMSMCGVGETLGPQLIAEIGDVHRFRNKQALVAFAGIDAPPYQSGKFESKDRSISKRGSPFLRKALFLVMSCLMQTSSVDDAVFQYLVKKRAEGKNFYVYMMAGSNKFLRIYYARVKAYLDSLETAA